MPVRTVLALHTSNDYTREVLEPDAAYYGKQRVGGSGSLTWTFPLNLGKAGMAKGYVRLSGGYGKALPEGSLGNAALSVGLFTL